MTGPELVICLACEGERWVCENHADKPWNESGWECGAGMPCPKCNPYDRDNPPELWPQPASDTREGEPIAKPTEPKGDA